MNGGPGGRWQGSVGGPWRSLLFVAANDAGRIAKLPQRGADVAVLDLEDAVLPSDKDAARAVLPDALAGLAAVGQTALVRINGDSVLHDADLAAAVRPGVAGLMVPKVEDAAALAALSERIAAAEAAQNLLPASIGLVALIETPLALFTLSAIAAVDRVVGLALGSEDFSAALGVSPSFDSLDLPARLVVLAAAGRGLASFAVPHSIADFTDLDGLERAADKARAFGASGALCIHPAQVAVINRVFTPTGSELREAQDIIDSWTAAGRPSVVSWKGRMIDRPVIRRAARLLGLRV